ncbi:MAG: Rrf2 family transcriptional regulator [Actinomycetota bacterium]
MRLARESRYAIEALVVLADAPPGEMMEARKIAEVAHLPAPFLSKILRLLALGDVLRSQRGRGYELARPAERITLGEILRAVEGDEVIWETCIFWREGCDTEHLCPLHFRWTELKPGIQDAMGSATLADIATHSFAPDARTGEHRSERQKSPKESKGRVSATRGVRSTSH